MPLSIDEATRRYESYVQNIQDSIFTLESLMGSNQTFSFDMPQAIGNLDAVDVLKEERAVALQIQSLEEYKKIISYEKKRRSVAEVIQTKQNINQLKIQLKTQRRSARVATSPYSKYKPLQQAQTTASTPTENTNTSMMIEEN